MDPAARARQAVTYFTAQLPDSVRQQAVAKHHPWPTSGLVYQYTSVSSLLAMISPDRNYVDSDPGALNNSMRHVWATSARFLNDSKEFDHGQMMIKAATRRVKARLSSAHKPLADLVTKAAGAAKGLDVFCACFSGKPDQLGQWRGYGDSGKGCALGFDLFELQNQVNGLGSWLIYGDVKDIVQNSVSERIIEDLVDILYFSRPSDAADQVIFDQAALNELEMLLPAVFLMFKDDSFVDEHEYRVIFSDSVARWPIVDANHRPRRWFRSSGPSIIPFVKLSYGNGNAAPLRKLRLGPASCWPSNIESLELMLERCGFEDVSVERSTIPFVPR
jgi:Protein of unknown function (DUF2971)